MQSSQRFTISFPCCWGSAAVFMPCFPVGILCSASSVRCGDLSTVSIQECYKDRVFSCWLARAVYGPHQQMRNLDGLAIGSTLSFPLCFHMLLSRWYFRICCAQKPSCFLPLLLCKSRTTSLLSRPLLTVHWGKNWKKVRDPVSLFQPGNS